MDVIISRVLRPFIDRTVGKPKVKVTRTGDITLEDVYFRCVDCVSAIVMFRCNLRLIAVSPIGCLGTFSCWLDLRTHAPHPLRGACVPPLLPHAPKSRGDDEADPLCAGVISSRI